MNGKDADFLKKLMSTFKIEAEEHIKIISSGLLELEKKIGTPEHEKIIETIFREAHSFKGAARAVNQTSIEIFCKSLESIFDSWKRHKTEPIAESLDVLHRTLDFLTKLVSGLDKQSSEADKNLINKETTAVHGMLETFLNKPKDEDIPTLDSVQQMLTEPLKPETILPKRSSKEKEKTVMSDTLRIPTGKLDSLFLKAEEIFSSKLSIGDRVEDLNKVLASFAEMKKEKAKVSGSIKTLERELKHSPNGKTNSVKKNGNTAKLIEYLNWNDSYSKTIERQLSTVVKMLKQNHRAIDTVTTGLLEDMKNVLMLPFSSLLEIFPKVVRELSREQKKDVALEVTGAEIEIDKRILEELKDPLMHLVRNCVDHGIEKTGERTQKGKNQRGLIKIDIAQRESGKVEINFSDDGTGIDIEKIRASAIKQKLFSESEAVAMSEQQILPLVFHSGISSSALITDISGRGLGLAIVREKVEKLGGTISISSHAGYGTTFKIVLPLTLATFRGIFVRAGEQLFVIPTANVNRAVRIKPDNIKTVENRETIQFDDKVLSLVKLIDLMGIEQRESENKPRDVYPVIIVSLNQNQIALVVDEILVEQEVLTKTLGKQLARIENISSVTVLGNGKVVPVLNVYDLIKSCAAAPKAKFVTTAEEKENTRRKTVLVAEDSITARALLKNILEVAGYEVSTAVDGLDAFTQMKTKSFDIVVSDVDMPRMSGFDLTLKIRSEKKLSETPVVLVTALESREDRERGIDVGANAYIVKSSFDQKNLLEVIRQLT